eukprot:341770-Rhodomonas_salina.1
MAYGSLCNARYWPSVVQYCPVLTSCIMQRYPPTRVPYTPGDVMQHYQPTMSGTDLSYYHMMLPQGTCRRGCQEAHEGSLCILCGKDGSHHTAHQCPETKQEGLFHLNCPPSLTDAKRLLFAMGSVAIRTKA